MQSIPLYKFKGLSKHQDDLRRLPWPRFKQPSQSLIQNPLLFTSDETNYLSRDLRHSARFSPCHYALQSFWPFSSSIVTSHQLSVMVYWRVDVRMRLGLRSMNIVWCNAGVILTNWLPITLPGVFARMVACIGELSLPLARNP